MFIKETIWRLIMGENRKILMTKHALSTALMTMLKTQHITQITVSKLCDTANINRTTFYKYYVNVLELLEEIENRILETFYISLGQMQHFAMNEKALYILQVLFEYVKTNHNYIAVLLTNSNYTAFQQKLIKALYERIDDNFPVSNSKNPVAFVYIIHGSIALIQQWIRNDFDLTSIEISKTILEFSNRLIN